jgi:hypothetical protein
VDNLPWIHVACGWCGVGFNTQDDMEDHCCDECLSLHIIWNEEAARTEEGLVVDSDTILT